MGGDGAHRGGFGWRLERSCGWGSSSRSCRRGLFVARPELGVRIGLHILRMGNSPSSVTCGKPLTSLCIRPSHRA